MKLYALPHQDGTISIMQLLAGHSVEHEIRRSVFSSPVILDGVTEITEQEAAAIRAQRPKPEIPPSVTPVSPQVHTDILLIQQKNDELERQVAELKQAFRDLPHWLADQISRGNTKAKEQ